MRVALVTAFPAQLDAPRGGVEAVSTTLVQSLAARPGMDVHVVTVRGDAPPAVIHMGGATVHVLPRRGRSALTGALGADRRQVQARLREIGADVVHAHDTFGLMARGVPGPRVLTIHGFIHADTKIARGRWAGLRAHLWERAEHAAWADYPHVIAISPYARRRLDPVVRGVVHDIDNPIDARCFDVVRRDAGPVVFCAAVISRRKNTLGLVEAVLRVRDAGHPVRLRLAGPVKEPRYHAEVQALIERRGAGDVVTLLGSLGAEQVREELGSAAVFALVSREEMAPMGIEEAMAAGVPVVTSDRCGMPFMVRHGETGWLVDPERPEDIALRLLDVLGSPARRAAMGARGREVALARFHPDVVAARTCEVYARALGR